MSEGPMPTSVIDRICAAWIERGRRNNPTEKFELSARLATERAAKRCLDVATAIVGLALLSPLMLVIYALVRSDGGSGLFGQTRIGRGGHSFRCFKFRSMVVGAESVLEAYLAKDPSAALEWARTQKLVDDPRTTKIGRFIRQTSLDELPQLWNVIRGDMSLVGPRPITPSERERYGHDFDLYIAVRPGITGLWQIGGRSACTYTERIALDVTYVREWRLSKDLVILVRTIPVVLSRRGSH